MAQHESKAQKKTVGRVMHEFKHGELPRGRGGKVKSRKQAIAAIASVAASAVMLALGEIRSVRAACDSLVAMARRSGQSAQPREPSPDLGR